MTISWLGHACFRFESKDISFLIDPFSKDTGLRPPRIHDQIIAVTHEHYDHNAYGDGEGAFLVQGPGEYEKSGVYIHGINSYHDNVDGAERGMNTIYIVTMEEMRLCHLGDLGQQKLTSEQVEEIGNVDILFVPIGGNYTINSEEAVAIIGLIEPKIIIPMHYKVPDLTIDIDGPEKFIKALGLTPEKVDTFKIQKKNLPIDEIKLVMFNQ